MVRTPRPTATARARRRTAGYLALAGLALAAGSWATATATAAPPEPPPDDVAAQAPAAAGGADVHVSESGNVVKELGEPSGLVVDGARRASFTMTVDEVETRTSCPGRASGTVLPGRRYFLVATLRAAMGADAGAAVDGDGDVYMPLTADAFRVLGPDGAVRGEPTEASWACFGDDELAAAFVGPGESTHGTVVLESDTSSGWLVYAPTGGAGWQWAFTG